MAGWVVSCSLWQQHRVKEAGTVTVDEFKAEFESRVAGTGHVLSLLAPWQDPANLKRAWCLFEILVAQTLKEAGRCKLEIIMPPDEETSFRRALVEEFDSIAQSVSRIDVANAKASVAQDEKAIKQAVQEQMGFEEVNKVVMGPIREWLADTGQAALAELPQSDRGTSVLINQLGLLLQD